MSTLQYKRDRRAINIGDTASAKPASGSTSIEWPVSVFNRTLIIPWNGLGKNSDELLIFMAIAFLTECHQKQ